jgi:hypothetical protein
MEIGLVFSILPTFYITSCLLINKIPRGIEKRGILIFAALISYVALSLCGPSKMWGLPDSLLILCIGLGLQGFFVASLIIPTLPEMIDSAL